MKQTKLWITFYDSSKRLVDAMLWKHLNESFTLDILLKKGQHAQTIHPCIGYVSDFLHLKIVQLAGQLPPLCPHQDRAKAGPETSWGASWQVTFQWWFGDLGIPIKKGCVFCFSTWSFQESLDTVFASNPKRTLNQKGETFIFVHPVVESFKYMFWPWCSENTWSTDIFVSPKGVNGGSNDWDFLFVDTSCLDCVWI